MEEQIKKLQEELELVKKERDNLILSDKKRIIINQLEQKIAPYYYSDIKEKLVNENYIMAMYQTYKTEIIQELINEYGYDLVVECMIELFLEEK